MDSGLTDTIMVRHQQLMTQTEFTPRELKQEKGVAAIACEKLSGKKKRQRKKYRRRRGNIIPPNKRESVLKRLLVYQKKVTTERK